MNFSVTPDRPPCNEFITAVESAIKQTKIDYVRAEELRHKVSSIVKNSKMPPPIVSSIGSVTYNVAKFAAKLLSPLVGQ